MKALLLYTSRFGRTRQVVREALRLLAIKPEVVEIGPDLAEDRLSDADLLLVFTPNYGDGELHEPMEEFLRRLKADLPMTRFAICELGNYGGYDDFSFGALHKVRTILLSLNAIELCQHLSLDSMPRLDSRQLDRWINMVNATANT